MRRSSRRLLALLVAVPLVVLGISTLYMLGMSNLEGEPRTFGDSVLWAAETLTSVGYGHDSYWEHPVMVAFVAVTQFTGIILLFLVFPVFLIPFFEERFEGRLPSALPALDNTVFVYRYGPSVEGLIAELEHGKVPVVIFEEDQATARRLYERGRKVVFGDLENDEPDLSNLARARALVANGPDELSAVISMSARQHGFEGPIVALVDDPLRRNPMMLAGATAAFTPLHVLAAAIAAKASHKISPRVAGAHAIGTHVEIAELRVHQASSLAGKTLAEARIRERTGATIIGQWRGDALDAQPGAHAVIEPGTILVAAGSHDSIERLGEVTRPIRETGHLVVAGFGGLGQKVAEFLRGAGETVIVLDAAEQKGVDIVGDVLDRGALDRAGVRDARAVILSLENDSATLFASTVVRELAPEVAIIASVRRAHNLSRIHRAGADFALSVSQVAGQVLTHHVLAEDSMSLEPRLKLVRARAGKLVGKNPIASGIRERTGCSIIAVERGDEVIVDFPKDFVLNDDDSLYVCGTPDAASAFVARYANPRAASHGDVLAAAET